MDSMVEIDKENDLNDLNEAMECDEEMLDDQSILDQLEKDADEISMDLLPEKSKKKYLLAYSKFMAWKKEAKIGELNFSESVMLVYFNSLKAIYKPTTIWCRYSMVKAVIQCNHNIPIACSKLTALLKKNAVGYRPKKANVFKPEELARFLAEAQDKEFLAAKVIAIFGIYGATRGEELIKVVVEDIRAEGDIFMVEIPDTKTNVARKFAVDIEYATYMRRYINLRPINVPHRRFFVNFQKGKCTQQPIGRNKFFSTPRTIADFLRLQNPELYTGHSFRRTSATLLSDSGASMTTLKQHGGWRSSTSVEGYLAESNTKKQIVGNMITGQIQNPKTPLTSTITSSMITSGDAMASQLVSISKKTATSTSGDAMASQLVSILKETATNSRVLLSQSNIVEMDVMKDICLEKMPLNKICNCENVTINFNYYHGDKTDTSAKRFE